MPIPVYPLDLTGNALTNHIVGEVRAITSNIERFIVPVGGPFYTVTMVVRNNVTNAILLPNTQYKILHHIPEASQDSGKNVCAVVYITDATVPAVRLEYQVVGGQYQNMVPLIMQLISEHPLDPNAPDQIGWGQIFGMPNQYPPTSHIHPANQFLGYSNLVMALENLRVAIANGDNMAISAIYRYIEIMFSSSQYVTVDQLNDLLVTPEPFVKIHPTYAALKQRDDMVANLAMVYGTIGRDVATDGLGMLFRWDATSTVAPDEKHVIRPNHIFGNSPGRFISLLWSQNVLDRHGIDAPIIRAGALTINQDLDTVKKPGKYYIETTQLNRPFDNAVLEVELVTGTMADQSTAYVIQTARGRREVATRVCIGGTWERWVIILNNHLRMTFPDILGTTVDLNDVVKPGHYYFATNLDNTATHPNRPFGVGFGMLEVAVMEDSTDPDYDHIIQTITAVLDNDLNDNTNPANNPFSQASLRGTKYTRVRFGPQWSPWERELSWETAQRHALHTPVLDYHQLDSTKNLDNYKFPGKYIFDNGTVNRPFDDGLLEVIVLRSNDHKYNNVSVTVGTPTDVLQIAKNSDNYAIRRFQSNAWTEWSFRAMRNGETDQVFNAATPAVGTETGTHVVNIAMQNAAFALLWNRLTANGIDADLAVTNNVNNGTDLDYLTVVGQFYYGPTCPNRPSAYGLLTVRRETESIIYQEAHSSDNEKYIRYRAADGVWTPWAMLVKSGAGGIEVYEIVIEGFSSGNGERWYTYTTLPNDINVEVRIVSPGGGGAGGGGTNNNGNEDYGGSGGGGGASGVMVLANINGVAAGTNIEVRIGSTADGGLGGTIGGHGQPGQSGGSSHLRVYEATYGKTLDVYLPGGPGGGSGLKGGINSCTVGSGAPSAGDITVNTQSFFTISRYLGQGGQNGSCDGANGGAGGAGGYIPQQAFNYYGNTPGGAGNSGHGDQGFILPSSRPYNFGRGGGGGGGGYRGQNVGGNGGGGGWGGAIYRITRLVSV